MTPPNGTAPVGYDVNPYTAAGAASLGHSVGSGQVAPWNELQPYGGPGIGFMRPQPVEQNAQTMAILPPDSLYTDRALQGGVWAFPARGEYSDVVPFTGGFELLAYRAPLSPMQGEQMQGADDAHMASWRAAPPVTQICPTALGA